MSGGLEVDSLSVDLLLSGELRRVLHGVSFSIAPSKAVGLIGESGSGKSMTARAIMGLLPRGSKALGSIRFAGKNIFSMSAKDLRIYRSTSVSMIYQNPLAHINPVRTIADFVSEGLRTTKGVPKGAALRQSAKLLEEVGLSSPQRLLSQFPHQLSGGMLQRVMIAAALSNEPSLLLADEPTTALDVTRQAEIVALINRLRRDHDLALLFVTHDIDLASAICDRICVMYAGSIVEIVRTSQLRAALHPYTQALLRARPSIEERKALVAIPGRPLSGFEAPDGCSFAARCPYAIPSCRSEDQLMRAFGDQHWVRCARAPIGACAEAATL